MCLAIPSQVVSVEGDDPAFLLGKVNFGGITKQISLAYTPEVRPGEYVLVHAGFSMQVVDEQEAKRSWQTLEELLKEFGEADSP
jgi:hydrogenase expression/formation protein HypC